MIACKHCNGRNICLFMLIDLLYLQKKTDLTEFAIIKPRHPVGLEKKTDLGGKKNSNGTMAADQCCHSVVTEKY